MLVVTDAATVVDPATLNQSPFEYNNPSLSSIDNLLDTLANSWDIIQHYPLPLLKSAARADSDSPLGLPLSSSPIDNETGSFASSHLAQPSPHWHSPSQENLRNPSSYVRMSKLPRQYAKRKVGPNVRLLVFLLSNALSDITADGVCSPRVSSTRAHLTLLFNALSHFFMAPLCSLSSAILVS